MSHFIILLHVVTHLWKLQCYYVVLVGYVPACSKFSERTNHQYLRIWLSDFVASCQISIEATKICYFGLVLSSIVCQPIRLLDVFNLKILKIIGSIKLIFCFHWSCKKYHAILGYDPKIVAQSVCRIFYFWLVWFVNLNIGVHCYIILVFFGLALKYIVVTEYNQSLQ